MAQARMDGGGRHLCADWRRGQPEGRSWYVPRVLLQAAPSHSPTHDVAATGIVLSYIFAGVVCVFSAFSYAEFAARIPISGSAYTYAYTTVGEFPAWIIGWDLTLEYMIGSAAVARYVPSDLLAYRSVLTVRERTGDGVATCVYCCQVWELNTRCI